jgi:RNA polymerase sigma-70 factor (ECF subfamily)
MASCVVLNSLPDEDLVRLCRQGHEDAFHLLYDRYRHRVLMTAYRIMRNSEDARDATQEIFLKAYLSLRRWNADKSKLSTWLFRLAANHAIDCWRARRRRARKEISRDCPTEGTQENPVSDAGSAPDRKLEWKEQAEEFRRCVCQLPELQRRFFILRHYCGLSLEEIAHREGRSLGTVKGSLHRAARSVGRSLNRAARRAKYLHAQSVC